LGPGDYWLFLGLCGFELLVNGKGLGSWLISGCGVSRVQSAIEWFCCGQKWCVRTQRHLLFKMQAKDMF
jgi:hypothetical protein